jgi:hypothetical protein
VVADPDGEGACGGGAADTRAATASAIEENPANRRITDARILLLVVLATRADLTLTGGSLPLFWQFRRV